MSIVTGFPPIANDKAVLLILGSMPSTRSLADQQYYAHPRNSFWYIMSGLLADHMAVGYSEKKSLLLQNRIALWDVLNSCQRNGSLDSSIKNDTIVVNDFNRFFASHPLIKAVFFNGTRAQQTFTRQVLPMLDERFSSLKYQRLPSTSPAMASLSPEQKLQQWKLILNYLD